jgi:hypothetical protein
MRGTAAVASLALAVDHASCRPISGSGGSPSTGSPSGILY